MQFGRVPVGEALDGVLTHRVVAGAVNLPKGHVLTADNVAALSAAGVTDVPLARLEAGDMGENAAAHRLALAAAGSNIRVEPPFTGRANLFAEKAGLLVVNRTRIDAFNALDEALTLATLPAFARAAQGDMVGTCKIIPFALPEGLVQAGEVALAGGALAIAPFTPKRVGMIALTLPSLKPSVSEKTRRVTEARLAALGCSLAFEQRVPHEADALGAALAGLDAASFDLLLIFGAAAMSDRRDVIPAALEAAGGHVEHLGMPVDPGNLLLIGEYHGKPVLGAPGCARSPRENGFDWVLARLVADIPVTRADIQGMGVGGLLTEIITRPQPRLGQKGESGGDGVAALILAAGRSTRFGTANKLLAKVAGVPMVVYVVRLAKAAGIAEPLIIIGHERDAVEATLVEEGGRFLHNPDYAAGLSTSLRAGIAALPPDVGAAFVMLGDMPRVKPATLRVMLVALTEAPDAQAIVPSFSGHWGNPVLLRRSLFPALATLTGDQGARKLLETLREAVHEVPVDDAGVLMDFDTPDALLRGDATSEPFSRP
jgi:molybdenum cofactor cytidylyltransferase